jgi:hypothetical protein
MRKPLELTVYEIDRSEPSMVVVDGFWAYRPYDPAKRLTDAELAAEVWKQEASVTTVEAMGGTPIRTLAALNTIHRFATRPHYDEAK